jgi:uncharacterized repeat protein (TIGR03847 family)
MAEPSREDLGEMDEIDAESIGPPGQRTFRVLLERGGTTVSLWLEKEQLQALGLVIEQHVARLPGERREGAILTLAARFPSQPTIDFKVGRMAVGFEERERKFVLTANNAAAEGEADRSIACSAPASQLVTLATKIAEIVAGGRPRCPLCGAPIEGTHVCPLSNGRVH